MPKYIFSLGLIPVQDFIAEARRSRDLRAGSAILSWFMRKALLHLKTKCKADILIPHQSCLEGEEPTFPAIMDEVAYSLPNRASGYFDAVDADAVFSELPKACLQDNWETLFEKYCEKDHYVKSKMEEYAQVFSDAFQNSGPPIDLIWVAKAAAGASDRENLEMIDQLYDNLKRTRPIREWSGKAVGKCDQCGKREAVGPDSNYDAWWDWHKKLRDEKWAKSGARLDSGERLCMVCFTKRFAGYAGYAGRRKFPSTSEIAARPWARQLEHSKDTDQKLWVSFRQYDSFRKNEDLDDLESFYYRRSLEKRLANYSNDDKTEKDLLLRLKKTRQQLVEQIKMRPDLNLKPEPSNYLAVMTFDGDGMGKKIKQHFDKLPEKLLGFAQAVRGKFMPDGADRLAEIFYLGGDEGLILAPIEAALQIAFDVNTLFHETVSEKIGENMTLSIGMTIFDRERPLGGAIRLAHEALKNKAKKLKGKNALSITIQTASGNEFSTTASWKGDFWRRVNNAIRLMNEEIPEVPHLRLSVGWAYEVETFLQTLPAGRWGEADFCQAVRDEIKRLTFRKLHVTRPMPAQEKRRKKIEAWQNLLAGETWFEPNLDNQDAETISNTLHTIAFLCRESAYLAEEQTEPTEGEV